MATHLFITFCIAFTAAFVATPLVRRFAARTGLVDQPGERRMHAVPMPKGGGLAIYAAFWLSAFTVVEPLGHLWPLWVTSTIILVLGLLDDARELPWYQKAGGQLLAAGLFVLWGGQIEFVTHPLTGASIYIGGWGVFLTIVWMVALTNMVNLIDGLDGLAAGVSVIACVPLFVVALALGRGDAAVLTAALAAATLGFLPHNFNPARIIMGDTGAMFLGFVLGAISVEGALKGPTALVFVVPVLALGLPIFDTCLSIGRRLVAGRPIYEADADHLHHRLLAHGLSHRQAVLALYAVSIAMGIGSLLATQMSAWGSLAMLAVILVATTLFAVRVSGSAVAASTTRHTL